MGRYGQVSEMSMVESLVEIIFEVAVIFACIKYISKE